MSIHVCKHKKSRNTDRFDCFANILIARYGQRHESNLRACYTDIILQEIFYIFVVTGQTLHIDNEINETFNILFFFLLTPIKINIHWKSKKKKKRKLDT